MSLGDDVVSKVLNHRDRYAGLGCEECPIILSRREYFMLKFYLKKAWPVRYSARKIIFFHGVRILREDKI
jgi:hypothetical protein